MQIISLNITKHEIDIIGVFILVDPSSHFSEGIQQLFPFLSAMAYPLQPCSVSREGWLIFLPEPKEISADFFNIYS